MPEPTLLIEGPFESDYSLAIVNRNLARAFRQQGVSLRLHQRDNTTSYFPSESFLKANEELAPLFVREIGQLTPDIHSRNIYPPYTDQLRGKLRVVHSYGWEESVFPKQFVNYFNSGLDLITVVSNYVREVLVRNGVTVPVEVVGNGADHILSAAARPVEWFRNDCFNFLHISSCFPRKAADVLVRAFCAEFTSRDDVRLVIKTFPNPHNEVERVVREVGQEYPRHAPIDLIFQSIDVAEMLYLYENAGCLVSASRGEGFGLPVAEAMLAGCPVIATIYSGQADICRPEHCWPVDYQLEPARTHLTEGSSLWANPVLGSLRAQMRNLYSSRQQERDTKTLAARDFVLNRFTWNAVSERHWEYCHTALASKCTSSGRGVPGVESATQYIGFVTTWNTKCGIAEYTRYLATSLPEDWRFAIFANRPSEELVRKDEDFVARCWEPFTPERPEIAKVDELVALILKSRVQAVSIQFNCYFFTPNSLAELIERLHQSQITVVLTMHSIMCPTFEQFKPVFDAVDVLICHRQADADAVRRVAAANVVLQRQGIVASRIGEGTEPDHESSVALHFVISCFGFFLPPKGIDQLIQAFALAKAVQPMLRLKLVNSLYPMAASTDYAHQCIGLIEEKGLQGDIQVCTAFLDHEQTLRELAGSDLVVLPYKYSTESSSAAGAFAVASLKPVLCSDLPLFDELSGVVHRFPAGDVFALANRILQLVADRKELNRYRAAQEQFVRERAWPVIARQFANTVAERVLSASVLDS
jgi:glycosyltransferase involved in cell wall biosynthesis